MKPAKTAKLESEVGKNPPRSHRFRRVGIAVLVALLIGVVGSYWIKERTTEIQYAGRTARQWVDLALSEKYGDANTNTDIILHIGDPALPCLIADLKDENHNPIMKGIEWLRWHLPQFLRWPEFDTCVDKHLNALHLLGLMKEKAQPAVPAIIRCFVTCPNLHFVPAQDCLDTLADIGHAATNAVPFLTQLARTGNSFSVRAAWVEYVITDKTNLLVETVQRLAKTKPSELLFTPELLWIGMDHDLSPVFVPMFIQMLSDQRLSDKDRELVVNELRSRGTNALPAVPLLERMAQSTTSPSLRSDVLAALPIIRGLVAAPEEAQDPAEASLESIPASNPAKSASLGAPRK